METEIIIGYHDNGILWYESEIFNGYNHGIQKWYHENGNINQQYIEINRELQGLYFEWLYDGARYTIDQRKNGEQHGPDIIFNYEN